MKRTLIAMTRPRATLIPLLVMSATLAYVVGVAPGAVPEPAAGAVPASAAGAVPAFAVAPSRVPIGDRPGWKQVMAEKFNVPAPLGSFETVYGSKFKVYKGVRDTSGRGLYSPQRTLSVAHGRLRVRVHSENGQPLVGAVLPRLADSRYGRYSIRYRADPVPGYKVSWMLWPNSGAWPDGGEIDFPEGGLATNIKAFMHYASPSGGQSIYTTDKTFDSWHTSTIEWTPGKVKFFLDGDLIGTATKKVPWKRMHWVIQVETQINKAPARKAAGKVRIAWMAAWKYAP